MVPFHLKNLEPLQNKLRDTIIGKKFLFVLDDVWYENSSNWDSLLVPFKFADKGSRIIVTTRSERVASSIGAMVQTYKLQVLSNEDCWSLFINHAFRDDNLDYYSNLQSIGRQIVEKCKGLPLASKTLGGLLHSKLDENHWQTILESEMWDLEGDGILPALSLSYHYLPPHLKQCFAYCCIFPKDYIISKDKLIRMWMAEGFVLSKQVERMEDIGRQYFDDLLQRSFFQQSEILKSGVVMHDLVHDLAKFISGDIYFRMESDKSCDISKKARHMPLIRGEKLESIDKELYKCKSLSTFISQEGWMPIEKEFFHDLYQELRCLRVLQLSFHGIGSLPDSIGNLKCLRYLELNSMSIGSLPESICKLYSLQTMILLGCPGIHELPKDTRKLTKLQHLVVEHHLSLPQGIGRLTYLKTLPMFHARNCHGIMIGELKELRHLEGALNIKGLQHVDSMDAKEANLKTKQKLDVLELRWDYNCEDEGDVEVLEGLQPPTGLKRLMIFRYDGSTFPNWMMAGLSSYNKLKILTLARCRSCKYLPPLGQLPFLEVLEMNNMRDVKYLGHEFYGDKEKPFQSLKFLLLSYMVNLKEWYGAEEGAFPCLETLRIISCEKLRKLPHFLPALKDVAIRGRLNLASALRLPSVSKLHMFYCGDNTLSSFCFQDISHMLPTMLPPLGGTLEELQIWGFQKLGSLLEKEDSVLQNFSRLKHLLMVNWRGLMSLPKGLRYLNSLEKLEIEDCVQLASFSEEDILPPKLKYLAIRGCPKLKSLPGELSDLSFLQDLVIECCNNLTSLPVMGLSTSLRSLTVIESNATLSIRCQVGGEDWHKIAHIPNVCFQKPKEQVRRIIPDWNRSYWKAGGQTGMGKDVLNEHSWINL